MTSSVNCGNADGKHRQRPHGQHQMARVEFGGQLAARLPPADAFQPACHRRAPFLFINHLSCALQRLPFEHTNPVGVLARGLEPKRQSFRRLAGRSLRPSLPFGNFPAQHRAEQALLVAEIMVEHPLVDRRAPCNRVHARAGKALRREFFERGGQNALARAPGIPRHGLPSNFAGLAIAHISNYMVT